MKSILKVNPKKHRHKPELSFKTECLRGPAEIADINIKVNLNQIEQLAYDAYQPLPLQFMAETGCTV